MNLYLISQNVNNDYDTYSDAVVAAWSEYEAKCIHPRGDYLWDAETEQWYCARYNPDGVLYKDFDTSFYNSWAKHIKDVKVKLIGAAALDVVKGVVLASYHAG